MYANAHPGALLEQQKRPCSQMGVRAHSLVNVPTSKQSGHTCLLGLPKCSATFSIGNKKLNHHT